MFLVHISVDGFNQYFGENGNPNGLPIMTSAAAKQVLNKILHRIHVGEMSSRLESCSPIIGNNGHYSFDGLCPILNSRVQVRGCIYRLVDVE